MIGEDSSVVEVVVVPLVVVVPVVQLVLVMKVKEETIENVIVPAEIKGVVPEVALIVILLEVMEVVVP